MRINFNTLTVPTRAAKRLKAQLSLKDSVARECTAFVLGYRNWHELQEQTGQWQASPLDEDLVAADLNARRHYQCSRLQEFAPRVLSELASASNVLEAWQPSAGRPQEPAAEKPEIDWDKSEVGQQFGATLIFALSPGKHPPLNMLDPLLLTGIRKTHHMNYIEGCCEVAHLLLARGDGLSKAFARKIFEAGSSRGNLSASHNLAISLMLGDGGPTDPKRAAELFQKLLSDPATPAEVRFAASGGLASALALGQGRPGKPKEAYALWEQMALEGDANAAFNVALYTDPNAPADRKMPADAAKSATFYRMAAKQGHVPAASNLGVLLLSRKELGLHIMEGYEWLQFAAERGDPTAQDYLRHLDKAVDKFSRQFF